MTKIESLKNVIDKNCDDVFTILACDCPSGYGMKDNEECNLKTSGRVDNWQCIKCWLGEKEENEN